jgi:hypothetical protein
MDLDYSANMKVVVLNIYYSGLYYHGFNHCLKQNMSLRIGS